MAHGPLVEYFASKGLVPLYQKEDSDLRELKKKCIHVLFNLHITYYQVIDNNFFFQPDALLIFEDDQKQGKEAICEKIRVRVTSVYC